MPTGTPYAQLQATVNGGAAVLSPAVVTVVPGDEVVLAGVSAGLLNAKEKKIEIWDYPEGFECPDDWTEENGIYYYAASGTAPVITIPTNLNITIGKYLCRHTVNGGSAGSSGRPANEFTDESLALVFESPDKIEDIGYLEDDQFDSQRIRGNGPHKRNIRRMHLGTWGTLLTDAAVTIQIGDGSRRALLATTLTTNRNITLGTTGAVAGRVFELIIQDQGFNAVIINGGAGAGTLYTLSTAPASGFWRARAIFDGTNWGRFGLYEN